MLLYKIVFEFFIEYNLNFSEVISNLASYVNL